MLSRGLSAPAEFLAALRDSRICESFWGVAGVGTKTKTQKYACME